MPPVLFERSGADYTPTEFARGPWSPDLLHGGAVGALVAQVLTDSLTTAAVPTRLTLGLLRPVPRDALSVSIEVLRRGRRMEVLRAAVRAAGALVADAVLIGVVPEPDTDDADDEALRQGPELDQLGRGAHPAVSLSLTEPTFLGDGMQVEYAVPEGPGATPAGWFRLRAAPLADRPVAPLARAAAAADLAGSVGERRGETLLRGFVNADIQVELLRVPTSDWLRLDAVSDWNPTGTGIVRAEISDHLGRVGAAHSVLVSQHGGGASWAPRRWKPVIV